MITFTGRNLGNVMRRAEPFFNRGIQARRLVRQGGKWRLELDAPVSAMIDHTTHQQEA